MKVNFTSSAIFLSVFLLISCGGGGSGDDPVDPPPQEPVEVFIDGISPSFGLSGTSINLQLSSNLPDDVLLSLSGQEVTPDSITEKALSFTVPDGIASGPLRLVGDNLNSNSIWFNVSENGVIAPSEDQMVTDDLGNNVVLSYLLVVLDSESDTRSEAQRLAELVDGDVVGRISIVNGWQIQVDVPTLEELEALEADLQADAAVDYVVIDVEIKPEANWADDPDVGEQRDRNKVEEGALLYENQVSRAPVEGQLLPFFMSLGISESSIDFTQDDFSEYGENGNSSSDNVAIYSAQGTSSHGSNVTGIVAAELGDGGNAGLLRAISGSHNGANISVASGSGSFVGRISATESQLESGAQVINWSWGLHKEGAQNCSAGDVSSNIFTDKRFESSKKLLTNFVDRLPSSYPQAVIVTSAGNGSTSAGDTENRLPSSIDSDRLIVVGAHTVSVSEDTIASDVCFPEAKVDSTDVKRAAYSNYGERVDISASGTITGFDNVSGRGTSYATPIVTATVALMQSIDPSLSPREIKQILRSSALPIENEVETSAGSDVFTRPLTLAESAENVNMGARLNVEGALQEVIAALAESLEREDLVSIEVPSGDETLTQTIEFTIPEEGAIFDKVDIMFVVDVSGSYSDDLSNFQSQANDLIEAFSESGADVNMGVSSFSDFPLSPYGSFRDYSFRLDQALTNDSALISSALDNLVILSGADFPESQLEAMAQTANLSGWRVGALPIIFLATDASFHDSDSDLDYPGTGYTATLQALNDRGIRVFGLQSGGEIDDVLQIVRDTDGQAFSLSRDSAEIVEAVISALDSTEEDISVQLIASGDFAGVVDKIVPTDVPDADDGAAIDNVNRGDTIKFDVTFTRGSLADDESRTFVFRLLVTVDGVAEILEIPVQITIN